MSQDYCFQCNGVTPSHSQRGAGRTTYHCSVCGCQTDADYDDDYRTGAGVWWNDSEAIVIDPATGEPLTIGAAK